MTGSDTPTQVLIVGCGDLGQRLAKRLYELGLNGRSTRIYGLRRQIEKLPHWMNPLAADICDVASLKIIPPEISHICYIVSAKNRNAETYYQTYVRGLANIIKVCNNSKLKRIIFVSSTSVYGQTDGEWVDEESPTSSHGFSAETMLAAESMLDDLSLPHTAVRFGGIYGPGRNRLIEMVRAGKMCRSEPIHWTNRIHSEDCSAVLHHLLQIDALHSVYNGVDNHPAPRFEVMSWLAQQLGVKAEKIEDNSLRGGNKRVCNKRLIASGYQFLYPDFRSGYQVILQAQYGSHQASSTSG